MPIHPKVRKLYEKYYNAINDVDAVTQSVPEEQVAINQMDKRFLEEVSEIIYGLELVMRRYINGGNH